MRSTPVWAPLRCPFFWLLPLAYALQGAVDRGQRNAHALGGSIRSKPPPDEGEGFIGG